MKLEHQSTTPSATLSVPNAIALDNAFPRGASKRRLSYALFYALFALSLALPLLSGADEKSTRKQASALQLTVPEGEGKVEFVATGWPSALKIHGRGEALAGELTIEGTTVQGTLSFALDDLETGIDLRDRHMKENYLETAKYPTASLELTHVALDEPAEAETFEVDDAPFEGTLQLHGLTRPIRGTADLTRKDTRLDVSATFEVSISDFGIDVPSYMGITVAETVTVKADFRAVIADLEAAVAPAPATTASVREEERRDAPR